MVTWYYKDMSSNNDFGLQTAYLSFLASHTGSILYKLLSFIFVLCLLSSKFAWGVIIYFQIIFTCVLLIFCSASYERDIPKSSSVFSVSCVAYACALLNSSAAQRRRKLTAANSLPRTYKKKYLQVNASTVQSTFDMHFNTGSSRERKCLKWGGKYLRANLYSKGVIRFIEHRVRWSH